MRLRVGRKVQRTVYFQHGEEPSDADTLIGMLDTPYSVAVVAGYNRGQYLENEYETCRQDWRYLLERLVRHRTEWLDEAAPKDAKTRDYGRGVAFGLSLVIEEMQRLDNLSLPPELQEPA